MFLVANGHLIQLITNQAQNETPEEREARIREETIRKETNGECKPINECEDDCVEENYCSNLSSDTPGDTRKPDCEIHDNKCVWNETSGECKGFSRLPRRL